ncbi:radical SAM protein [Kitasatospora sp. NBC_01287]|uniref:radical SAM protein n=1 Tax=Kitasatospora sp. NBC_01287 TaxID=2903573 RepID=UPI002253BF53|nr:radical SAM protein [Kitasatospora sp. NBC_01287]MCX4745975.1 radical SAM protein [Kitasatospora sp. NBC_01287]
MTTSATRLRVYENVIDQHDSYTVMNPVQGCPKRCRYCFLQQRFQTGVKPVELAGPADTVQRLLSSPYYRPGGVLAAYTCTDALATPPNRRHLIGLLRELTCAHVTNPLVLISKCAPTPEVIDAVTAARANRLPVIMYLSYSGLEPDVELGIDHQALRRSFGLWHSAGVPVVHYWRPFLPQNSTEEAMRTVLDTVVGRSACSVAVGLKTPPGAFDQMAGLWDGLPADAAAADAVWPEQARQLLERLPAEYGHLVYESNSCALAHVTDRPDDAGVWGSEVCAAADLCPPDQRRLCRATWRTPAPLATEQIDAELTRLGLAGTPYEWDPAERRLRLTVPARRADTTSLTYALHVRVTAPREATDLYWPGRIGGSLPLIAS